MTKKEDLLLVDLFKPEKKIWKIENKLLDKMKKAQITHKGLKSQ